MDEELDFERLLKILDEVGDCDDLSLVEASLLLLLFEVKFKDFDKFMRLKELFREAGIYVEKFLG